MKPEEIKTGRSYRTIDGTVWTIKRVRSGEATNQFDRKESVIHLANYFVEEVNLPVERNKWQRR